MILYKKWAHVGASRFDWTIVGIVKDNLFWTPFWHPPGARVLSHESQRITHFSAPSTPDGKNEKKMGPTDWYKQTSNMVGSPCALPTGIKGTRSGTMGVASRGGKPGGHPVHSDAVDGDERSPFSP